MNIEFINELVFSDSFCFEIHFINNYRFITMDTYEISETIMFKIRHE